MSLMDWAKKDLIDALVDCAKLIINRNVPIAARQLSALRREANNLNQLVRTKANATTDRRRILQRGGLLGALLGPIITSVLPSLVQGIGGLFGGNGRRRRR